MADALKGFSEPDGEGLAAGVAEEVASGAVDAGAIFMVELLYGLI